MQASKAPNRLRKPRESRQPRQPLQQVNVLCSNHGSQVCFFLVLMSGRLKNYNYNSNYLLSISVVFIIADLFVVVWEIIYKSRTHFN